MADIEERAEKWAREYDREHYNEIQGYAEVDLIAAYLAGSAQTQRDYVAHYAAPDPRDVGPCERHGKIGCAWCIPGPFVGCERCECSCGAR